MNHVIKQQQQREVLEGICKLSLDETTSLLGQEELNSFTWPRNTELALEVSQCRQMGAESDLDVLFQQREPEISRFVEMGKPYCENI